MKVYRYEKKDGGGPWCALNGQMREGMGPPIHFEDDIVYGCISLESLHSYFKDYQNILKDCSLKIYEIPDNEVIICERQVCFPKLYVYQNTNLT